MTTEPQPTPASEPTKALGLWTNDYDTVIAYDREDAIALWAENIGEDPDFYDPTEWERLPDDKPVRIYEDDDTSKPPTEKMPAEWIAQNGRGFLCSTEF